MVKLLGFFFIFYLNSSNLTMGFGFLWFTVRFTVQLGVFAMCHSTFISSIEIWFIGVHNLHIELDQPNKFKIQRSASIPLPLNSIASKYMNVVLFEQSN